MPVKRMAVLAWWWLVAAAAALSAQPAITNLSPADGSLLSSRTGTLSGRAEGAVLLRVDGVQLTLGGGGGFSYSFDLPEGESALSIYAEDAGGLATSQVHHLDVDTLAPGIVVSAPAQVRVGASPVEVAWSLPASYHFESDAAHNLTEVRRQSACGPEVTRLPADGSGRHRPASINDDILEWDSRGRLVRKRDQSFRFDDGDRRIEVTGDSGGGATPVANYDYDYFNRRIARIVGGVSIETAWDGWQSIEDYENGAVVSRRVYGEGLDEVLQLQLNLGAGLQTYYPVYDTVGNVAMLLSAAGQIVERYEYGPFGDRLIHVDDHQPPRIEQVRVEAGAIWLQLSEGSVTQPEASKFLLRNLSRPEQPVLRLRGVTTGGRQFGRQLALENGGDPAASPSSWPQPGEQVSFTAEAGSFADSFKNESAAFEFATAVWPASSGILYDTTPPRLEEVCVQGEYLKLSFSERVNAQVAAAVFAVDGEPVEWLEENGGYTLRVGLPSGSHQLTATTAPLDLAGLGLGQTLSESLSVDDSSHQIYVAPFPGEVAQSTVGNVYGFKGLPEDPETGFLYVRARVPITLERP